MNLLEKFIKFLAIFINILIVFTGLLAAFFFIIKRQFTGLLFIPVAFSLLYIFYIGFIFKFAEVRYLAPLYPFLLISSLFIIHLKYGRENQPN